MDGDEFVEAVAEDLQKLRRKLARIGLSGDFDIQLKSMEDFHALNCLPRSVRSMAYMPADSEYDPSVAAKIIGVRFLRP